MDKSLTENVLRVGERGKKKKEIKSDINKHFKESCSKVRVFNL